jgi:hypothetical protein
MSEAFRIVNAWKLAIFQAAVGMFIIGLSSAFSTDFEWHTSTNWQRVRWASLGLIVPMLKSLDMFLNSVVQNIRSKRGLFGEELDDSQSTVTIPAVAAVTVNIDPPKT